MKTMAIRIDDELHTRLAVVAQLSGTTITDAIRRAIVDYIDNLTADGTLAAKSRQLLEQMERDIAQRRDAIANLFGGAETISDDRNRPHLKEAPDAARARAAVATTTSTQPRRPTPTT